ncbi:MAG: hypothetical protein ACI3XP_02330 [Eubacteriales bacterium]
MMKIRFLALAFASALLFSACRAAPAEVDPPASDTSAPDTAAPTPDISLVADGATDYIIVRGDLSSQKETDAAVFLRKYIEKCGVKIKITTDWEGNGKSEHEIVVGDTVRTDGDGNTLDPHSVGEEGYFAYASGGRIYLGGGSDESVQKAVEAFLAEFFGYAGDPDTAAAVTTVTVPGDYCAAVRQTYALEKVEIGGQDLSGYTIVARDRTQKKIAEQMQARFYQACGVWLPIAEEDPAGACIRFDTSAADREGYFQMDVLDGDLVLRTALSGGLERGFSQFCSQYLNHAKGTLSMNDTFHFEADIGSYVTYSEFGAVGDGKTNDIAAIIQAHEYANANHLAVRADAGATYYIGAASAGAVIRTDTDWTGASFIIDDSDVGLDRRSVNIFNVKSIKETYTITGLTTLERGQANLGIMLPEPSIVVINNSNVKHYIREGKNANSGSDQTDIVLVDQDGNIDQNAPLIWDYEQVTGAYAIPIDTETLTIKGGTFTTIANNQPSASTYYGRGIKINRSNTVVEGLTHYVTGEGDTGAPYSGILQISDCANVTVKNCTFTAHKTYQNNAKGLGTVSQGTYDISPSRAVNLTFENCTQTTDILNTAYWGIMGSNFCKNIVVDGCTFSRFDAHQGVANVTIRNSTLGHQCLNAIGCGTLTVENSTLYGSSFINLRGDYGSTWEGDVIIRDCTWIPSCGKGVGNTASLINGSYSGFHDFGYECYMPANITIDGLYVKDEKHSAAYKGIYLLGNITSAYTSEAYEKKVAAEGYPYHITETITIQNFRTDTGKSWMLSPNKFMYRNVVVNDLDAAK